MSTEELACTYAALILHDDGVKATADNLKNVITAAGVKINPYWCKIFAKFLEGRNVDDLLMNVGAAPSTTTATTADATATEEVVEEKVEEEESESSSDGDMGFGLFD